MNIKSIFHTIQKLRQTESNQGFTLVELLVVVIIIGILSAIALPQFLAQATRARQTEVQGTLGAINRAQQVYRVENPTFGQITDLIANGSISIDLSQDYYNYTDIAADGMEAKHRAEAVSEYTNELPDYASAIFFSQSPLYLDSVICQASNSSVVPQADADPAAASICVNGTEIK